MKGNGKRITGVLTMLSAVLLLSGCSVDFPDEETSLNEFTNKTEYITEAAKTTIAETHKYEAASYNYIAEDTIEFSDGYFSDGVYYPDDCGSVDEVFRILRKEFRDYNNTVRFSGRIEDEVFSAISEQISLEYPEFYWVSGYSWKYDGVTTDITFKTIADKSMDEISTLSSELEKKVNSIISMTDPALSDYDKILFVHDYIVTNTVYDNEGAQSIINGGSGLYSSAYGCLVEGHAVCQGYAEAFMILMNRLGIECGISSGSTERGDHAWNYVKIDDEYYWVDVTWDDPVMDNDENVLRYNYFLLNDELFMRNRIPDDPEKNPVCSSMKYNYFAVNDLYVDTYSFTDLNEKINSHLSDRDISFLFSSEYELSRCIDDLIENKNVWLLDAVDSENGKISYSTDDEMNIFTLKY